MTDASPKWAGLKDVAYLLNRAYTTVLSDWRRRVEEGELPAPIKERPPTWNRADLEDHLDGFGKAPKRAAPHTRPTRADATDAGDLRALQSQNRYRRTA